MALLTKINSATFASINKWNGLAKTSTNKISGARSFVDNNAVAKALDTSGSGHEIFIADSEGAFRFDHDDAMSVSFWIKAGWNLSHNGYIHLFTFHDVGGGTHDDSFRMYYYEPHGRLWVDWRSASDEKHEQFWHFHDDNATYGTAYEAAGLGGGMWNSAARGSVGDDDYTLITITRGTANTALHANLKLYWNTADCGAGYYRSGTSGGTGTPNMGNSTDKVVALGDASWAFTAPGNNVETKYNGLTIWNKELDSSEVTELYNSGTPLHVGTHSAYAECLGWWNFEDDGVDEVSRTQTFAINGDSNLEAK